LWAHLLLAIVVAPCCAVAESGGVPDEKPRQTKGRKDLPELEKRLDAEFSADRREADRRFKQMVKEDPHDIRGWQLLAWNTAYNLSVTTRNVNERYAYVKRGIEHLLDGVGHNPKNAALYWDTGFFLHDKIGKGSDRRTLRALFRNDKAFHKLLAGHVDLKGATGPDGLPDNILVAQRWCEKTLAIVEKHGRPAEFPEWVRPAVLNAFPAIYQGAYAAAIEDEGHFGEAAGDAWKKALSMWEAVGERELVAPDGKKFRLIDDEAARAQVNFDYWKRRCRAEQSEPVLTARQATYRLERHLANQPADPTDEARTETRALFYQVFRAWAKVYKAHPWLGEKETDLEGLVRQYQRRVLNGKPLPDDFPFRQIPPRSPRER
jgi:hypothetical protein